MRQNGGTTKRERHRSIPGGMAQGKPLTRGGSEGVESAVAGRMVLRNKVHQPEAAPALMLTGEESKPPRWHC